MTKHIDTVLLVPLFATASVISPFVWWSLIHNSDIKDRSQFSVELLWSAVAINVVTIVVMMLWFGRRRFYRRNVAGLEEHSSYAAGLGWFFLSWFMGITATVFGITVVTALLGLFFASSAK